MKFHKTDLFQLIIPVFLGWQYYMDYIEVEGLCIAVTMWIGTYFLVNYSAQKKECNECSKKIPTTCKRSTHRKC